MTGYFGSASDGSHFNNYGTQKPVPSRLLPFVYNEVYGSITKLPVQDSNSARHFVLYLISASSQERAYFLANGLNALFGVVYGQHRHGELPWLLLRLKNKPQAGKSTSTLLELVDEIIESPCSGGWKSVIGSGTLISQPICKHARRIYSVLLDKLPLMHTLINLEFSYFIVPSQISENNYDVLLRSYNAQSEEVLKKAYYEEKMKYDLAYLSAFRGLEAFLKVNRIQKKDIEKLFSQVDTEYGSALSSSKYQCRYIGMPDIGKLVSYVDVTYQFLIYRNSVAAHWNPIRNTEPLNELVVCEIQHYVSDLLEQCINTIVDERYRICITLPRGAKVCVGSLQEVSSRKQAPDVTQ